MSEPDRFATLVAALHETDLDLDGTDMADLLWLAVQLPATRQPETPTPSPPRDADRNDTESSSPPASSTSDGPAPSTAPPRTQAGPDRHVYPRGVPTESGVPIRLRDRAALADKLALGRALRPLRRSVPSLRGELLDEVATARRIASMRLAWPKAPLIPVTRPTQARWLDCVVVIDRSQTAALWRKKLQEWEQLLQRVGAFRDVQVWHMVPRENGGGPQLLSPTGADESKQWVQRSENELQEAQGRRLVLVATDCIGPLWQRPEMGRWLERRADAGPVALVQLLPAFHWDRTALGYLPEFSMSAAPGCDLSPRMLSTPIVDEDDEEGALEEGESIVIPVVPMQPAAIGAWARLLAGHPSGRAMGYAFGHLQPADDEDPDAAAPPIEVLVQEFLATSSRRARALASHLAAVPLTMPVIRIVLDTFVPTAGDDHLAEVLFSGLLRQRVADVWEAEPDEEVYDFHEGARELLMETLGSTTIESVARQIGNAIAAQRGDEYNFSAILDVRGGNAAAGGRAFASVSGAIASVLSSRRSPPTTHAEEATAPSPSPLVAQRPTDGPPVGLENGVWVLVDGDASYELPEETLEAAEMLGTALARWGCSLITLGTPGVAYVVARTFWAALQTEGYPSGISRILAIVEDGKSPDFERGRALAPSGGETVAQAALRRCDVVVVGLGPTRLGKASGADGIPSLVLDGTDLDAVWGFVSQSAAPRDPAESRLRSDLRRAELTIDEPSLEGYNERLAALEHGLRRSSSAMDGTLVARLAADPRRLSRRMLGLLSAPPTADTLVDALIAETNAVRHAWETRGIWLALEAADDYRPFEKRSEGAALAAAGALAFRELRRDRRIDPGGECVGFLERWLEEEPAFERACRLEAIATTYDEVRGNQAPGEARTAELDSLFRDIGNLARAETLLEARVWATSGGDGGRIVALGLLLFAEDVPANALDMVEQAITESRSAFEQYHALHVAERLVRSLSIEGRGRLSRAVERARGRRFRRDASRWALSERILQTLSSLEATVFSSARPIVPIVAGGLDPSLDGVWREEFGPYLHHAPELAERTAAVLLERTDILGTAFISSGAGLTATQVVGSRVASIALAPVDHVRSSAEAGPLLRGFIEIEGAREREAMTRLELPALKLDDVRVALSPPSIADPVAVVGYVDGGRCWMPGRVVEVHDDGTIHYDATTGRGCEGAPVFALGGDTPELVAIHQGRKSTSGYGSWHVADALFGPTFAPLDKLLEIESGVFPVAFILGPFGSGKSFILRALVERLEQAGRPITPRAIALTIDESVNSMAARLASALDATGLTDIDPSLSPVRRRSWLVGAVTRVVRERGPCLLAFDDLGNASENAQEVVYQLARAATEVGNLRIAISDPPRDWVDELRKDAIILELPSFRKAGDSASALARVSAAVCAVEISRKRSAGEASTGFLVGSKYVLAPYHVVANVPIESIRVAFHGDERSLERIEVVRDLCGAPPAPHEVRAEADTANATPEELDFVLLELQRPPDLTREPLVLPVQPPKMNVEDVLFIVQTANAHEQPSIRNGTWLGSSGNGTRVRYRAGELRGVSGAPVLDAELRLVAMHHYRDRHFSQGIPLDRVRAMIEAAGFGDALARPD